MLRNHRLRAFQVCLLIVSVVMLSATAVALAANASPFQTAGPARSHTTISARASRRGATGRKSSPSRRTKCVAAARGGKHRKARKSCAVRKSKKRGTKRSVSRRRSGSKAFPSPAVVFPSLQTPAAGGAAPTGASAAPGSESGSSPESPGGSGSSPGETTTPSEPTPPVEPVEPVEPVASFRFFSPTSVWNGPLLADALLDPSSAAVVGALDEEIAAAEKAKKGLANINTTKWSVPIYTVPADQPTVKVTLVGGRVSPGLVAAWDMVPLPSNAKPAAGTDKHLVVWKPSTNKLWEFWHLEDGPSGWEAEWGGAMEKASSNPGAYGPDAWPGAKSWWGASACSLSIAGGLITLEDLELGQINHALAIAVPNTRGGVYAAPAQRTDGWSTAPGSLPEGAHLRLDPNLDLASLHLPRLTLMMAEAAQRYGIVVRDSAANVTFYAQDPIPTGTEPYTGAHGYFEGKSPQQLLASFPWSHLQLLKMELHTTS
jgi:hypothetical protein